MLPVRSHLHPVLFRGWRRLQGKDVTLDWAPATLWYPRLYIPCLLHLGFSWNITNLYLEPCPSGSLSSLLVVVSSCAPASLVTVHPRARNRFHSRVRSPWLSSRPASTTAASKTISTMNDPVIRTASPYTDPNVKGPRVQLLSSGQSSSFINTINNNNKNNSKSSNSKYPNFPALKLHRQCPRIHRHTPCIPTMPLMTNGRHIIIVNQSTYSTDCSDTKKVRHR